MTTAAKAAAAAGGGDRANSLLNGKFLIVLMLLQMDKDRAAKGNEVNGTVSTESIGGKERICNEKMLYDAPLHCGCSLVFEEKEEKG
ncbi:hypothetical protein TYRP_004716 [Tyrophagus putrescentiae]|nr:hypothetical protein TYRP_004716 [Tyrophagus putrescentiae]